MTFIIPVTIVLGSPTLKGAVITVALTVFGWALNRAPRRTN